MIDRRTSRRANQSDVIRVSPNAASGLSSYRKEEIASQVEQGIIQEGSAYVGSQLVKKASVSAQSGKAFDGPNYNRGSWQEAPGATVSSGNYRYGAGALSNRTGMGIGAVVHSQSFIEGSLQKQASALGLSSGTGSLTSAGGASGPGGVDRLAPEVYSPLFTMANLNLPREGNTIRAWCRNFFDLHPIVRNAITLHATYPISKLNLKCHDRKVLQFFEDMIENMNLMDGLGSLALEFWKIGEVFPFLDLDEQSGQWSRMIIHNPDYIHVKKTVMAGEPLISMKADQVLQRLVMSNNPADVQIRKQIPENIQYYVRKGLPIPLDNFHLSHLKMLASPYDVRGTSIIVSVFKDLMLYDKLRECKFAQADSMVNPITIVKVGGSADGEYRATQEDLNFYKQMLEESQYDKDFKLITHAGVDIQKVGSNGAIVETGADFEMIMKNLFTGLMVPQAIIDSDASSYNSASVGLEVLRQRYFNFRNMLSNWLQAKVFAPISDLHNFTEYKDGTRRLIVPEVEWNKMNLYDLQDYIGNITGLLSQKQVSLQTVYKSLGLNYEEELERQRQEMINQAISLKEQEAISMMTLTELRALDPAKPISEPVANKELPKSPAGGGLGGGGSGLEMPMPGGLGGGAPMPELGGGMPELAPPPTGEIGSGGGGGGGMGGLPSGAPPLGPGV